MKKYKKTTIVPHRRRREKKTDYRFRLRLLKSGKPRFVVRRSLNSITCQIIAYNPAGDRVLATAHSRELKKLGWAGHTGNVPAAYLTGMLCGVRAKGKAPACVFDAGLYKFTKGMRIRSALKGGLDAGLQIPCSADVLPSAEQVSGKHIADFAAKLKSENPDKFRKIFSRSRAEDLPRHAEEVKARILKAAKPEAKKVAKKPVKKAARKVVKKPSSSI